METHNKENSEPIDMNQVIAYLKSKGCKYIIDYDGTRLCSTGIDPINTSLKGIKGYSSGELAKELASRDL